jgi:hypothetical protein
MADLGKIIHNELAHFHRCIDVDVILIDPQIAKMLIVNSQVVQCSHYITVSEVVELPVEATVQTADVIFSNYVIANDQSLTEGFLVTSKKLMRDPVAQITFSYFYAIKAKKTIYRWYIVFFVPINAFFQFPD